jgi:hypothetical protein
MLPQSKTVVAINGSAPTNGENVTGQIDCIGYDFATIDIIATTANVVSNKPTVVKLQELDTTVVSSFADISGAIGGTDFTIPNANTAATAVIQNIYSFNVDLRGRKRYLQVSYTPRTTQTVVAVAKLFRGEEAPITAAKANAMTLAAV